MTSDLTPLRRRMRAVVRRYGPNHSKNVGLVHLNHPSDEVWPMRLIQLVGGRRWSVALIRYQTPAPVLTEYGQAELERLASAAGLEVPRGA